jgi:hypothetical protein
MRILTPMLATLAVLTSACSIGPNPTTLAPATGPEGTPAAFLFGEDGADLNVSGELIAVREDDVLLLMPSGLARLPNQLIQSATFGEALPRRITGAGSASQRASLAQYSRYPFGLEGDQLARLLQALDQSELIELGP